MEKTMKVALLDNKTLEISIENRDVPSISDDQVLIKVEAVGICGSDSHYYDHGKIGDFIVKKPIVLGHECSGSISKVGKNVKHLKIGDRVAIEPGVPCGNCESCRTGNYNLCKDVEFLATPPIDGAFAQYLAHDSNYVFKIPDSMSFEKATLVEPLSVGLHAANKIGVRPGKSIAIFGMGPIGLTSIIAVKSYGINEIIAIDFEEKRLEAAKKLGATKTICLKDNDAVNVIKEYTDGKGVDFAFETAGASSALQNALSVLGQGGHLAIIGLPPQKDIELNIPSIADREIQINGIFRYANTYQTGIDVLANFHVDTDFLFTNSFVLNDTKKGMDFIKENKATALKVIIYPNKEA